MSKEENIFTVDDGYLYKSGIGTLNRKYSKAGLLELVNGWPEPLGIDAGYTYFGQFLAHELVQKDPFTRGGSAETITPYLDLSSLYGTGLHHTVAGEKIFDSSGRFRLGWTSPVSGVASERDLPRKNRMALIPEPRNDENLIIAQLHCLFMRLHNHVVSKLEATDFTPGRIFSAARLYTIETILRIVEQDYLKQMISPDIYQALTDENSARTFFTLKQTNALPFEYTHACFRFGHSMVRDSYFLNAAYGGSSVGLHGIFLMTGRAGLWSENGTQQFRQIPEDHVLDWRLFLSAAEKDDVPGFNHARGVSPHISKHMQNLLEAHDTNIVLRNLAAGEKRNLPAGENLAAYIRDTLITRGFEDFGISPQLDYSLVSSDHLPAIRLLLEGAEIRAGTPLWIFILLEAFTSRHLNHQTQLGPLCSFIVGNVLMNAIINQRNRYSDDDRHTLHAVEHIVTAGINQPVNTLSLLTRIIH